MNTTTKDATEALAQLGFTLECSTPFAGVDDDRWPHIGYMVTIGYTRNGAGRIAHQGAYRMGVGHVDPKKGRPDGITQVWTENERSLLYTWQSKPHADFKDKELQAQVAAKLAKLQKVSPSLADVLHSLLMDGEPFFNAQSFEQWADEFGYDKDSRKAEAIYRQCDATGRKLAGAVPADVLDKAREITRDL